MENHGHLLRIMKNHEMRGRNYGLENSFTTGIKKDARDLLESHGHTLIDGRGFETEDVIADMKEP